MLRQKRPLSDADLSTFVKKVQRLKAEGLSVILIAERLQITRNTVNARLRTAAASPSKG